MDPVQPPANTSSPTNLSEEFAHITEEMYKKNLELAERNKTLSLLRKIDEIILSSVTDTYELAQQVVNITSVEAGFKRTEILLVEKGQNFMTRIAINESEAITQAESTIKKSLKNTELSLNEDSNIIVTCIKQRNALITHNFDDIIKPYLTSEEAKQLQEVLGIKTTYVYPLIVRGGILGALTISIDEYQDTLSQFMKDLVGRLADIIGIAIDSSQLYKKIQEANEKLKQLDKLKDEFVSLASHELRTPMTAIKSYLWMALAGKGGPLTEKQKYYLDRSYNSTDRLIKLVNDMLNVSRIESGRISLEIKPIPLEKTINDVIGEIMPRAQELGVHVSFTSPPEPMPQVLADTDKIKEVLINLIGNSLKFTPKDGQIKIISTFSNNMIQTEIQDNGKGIKVEDISKLFQKFGIVGNSNLTKQNAQGTGLGLYITKSLIELHGGKIWANSEGENKGTSFYFTLPIVK